MISETEDDLEESYWCTGSPF